MINKFWPKILILWDKALRYCSCWNSKWKQLLQWKDLVNKDLATKKSGVFPDKLLLVKVLKELSFSPKMDPMKLNSAFLIASLLLTGKAKFLKVLKMVDQRSWKKQSIFLSWKKSCFGLGCDAINCRPFKFFTKEKKWRERNTKFKWVQKGKKEKKRT